MYLLYVFLMFCFSVYNYNALMFVYIVIYIVIFFPEKKVDSLKETDLQESFV